MQQTLSAQQGAPFVTDCTVDLGEGGRLAGIFAGQGI